jgi:hypothetical protein
MTQQNQAASWHRAFLLLLVGICAAWLQGCATKPQAQYKVYHQLKREIESNQTK